jgi:hypothetical protein
MKGYRKWILEKVEVTCPVCSISRFVSRGQTLHCDYSGRCGSCAGRQGMKRSRENIKVSCGMIGPAKEGVRCGGEPVIGCPHYEDCLDKVAIVDWPGWRITDG